MRVFRVSKLYTYVPMFCFTYEIFFNSFTHFNTVFMKTRKLASLGKDKTFYEDCER